MFIIFITNSTTADIANIINKNVVANVFTFSIDFVALSNSSTFVFNV